MRIGHYTLEEEIGRGGMGIVVQPANFAPRVKIPILIINGRDDFSSPPDVLERLLSLFGTPPGQKSIKLFPGGHVPQDMRNLVRETLDWFDKYLGPV